MNQIVDYILCFSFVFIGIFLFEMSMFEIFLIVVLGSIVFRLIDIKEVIEEK